MLIVAIVVGLGCVGGTGLTLYEVATHRQVAQARMTAAGECPFIVLLMADRTIINEVTDRQLYEALHQYVER